MESLLLIFKIISIKDILDILIVSIFIYQIVQFFYRTRAFQIALAMSFLIVLFFVGQYFKLNTLNWILDNIIDKSFFVLIILFQDQIKQWLAKFGKQVGPQEYFSNFYLKNNKNNFDYDEIVDACATLSRKKIGGLIVLENVNGLENYIQTGTPLNASINSGLILSIFNIKSPLHDGALIISKNIIKAVGCFLTLSKSVELVKTMGTRHRAALGLSEESDALIIVVSEETGGITLFYQKQMLAINMANDLLEILNKIYKRKDAKVDLILDEYKRIGSI